jgi:GGDEF domain-containing protein
MKQMRWRTIFLVLWLTLLFNIERIDIDQGSPFNLASSVYVLAMGTVVVFLLVPLTRRQMYLSSLGVLAIYTSFKALHLSPFFSGVHKFLTITEIVALLITAGLTWLVSQSLRDFEDAVEAISMPEGRQQLLPYNKVQERMRAEMGRARRHQRPISVAMLDLDPSTFEAALHQAVRDAQAALIERYVKVRLGLFLSKQIRETDVIAQQVEDGRFLLLAPETPADQMTAMLKRLSREVENQMGIRFRYGIADFPDGALTSEELLRKVKEDLQNASFQTAAASTQSSEQPAPAPSDDVYAYAAQEEQEDGLDAMMLTQVVGDKETGNGTRYHNSNTSKNGNSLVS